ncbi:hypothetical protein [Alkalihalophilus marmarensis]|uniref:hypothetical protein n=1 Tax=Alkalihalophilus marmarensis TaxID=521377 RepID=UPI002E1FAB9E|nr:hypothetical protein [Alkalihalophilus marmarensis]
MFNKYNKIWLCLFGMISILYVSSFFYSGIRAWRDMGEIHFNWLYLILGFIFGYWFIQLTKKPCLLNITLENIERKMVEMGLNNAFIEELRHVLSSRLNTYGESAFREWFAGLNYQLPEEFKDEKAAIKLYKDHAELIEKQVKTLEQETKLTWGEQTVDLVGMNEKSRKVQLVIRHRLSDIALDLVD